MYDYQIMYSVHCTHYRISVSGGKHTKYKVYDKCTQILSIAGTTFYFWNAASNDLNFQQISEKESINSD